MKAFISKDRLVNKTRSIKIALETIRRVLLGMQTMPFDLKKVHLNEL